MDDLDFDNPGISELLVHGDRCLVEAQAAALSGDLDKAQALLAVAGGWSRLLGAYAQALRALPAEP